MTTLEEQFFDDFESSEEEATKNTSTGDATQDASSGSGGASVAGTGAGRELLAETDDGVGEDSQLTDEVSQILAAISGGSGDVRDDRELVTACVGLVTRLDELMRIQHRNLQELYALRFPELATIVLDVESYARVVQRAGNRDDISQVELGDVLPAGSVITVQVTAASSTGRTLADSEHARTQKLAKFILDTADARRKILAHVEARAVVLAPNLTAVVGARVAATLLGLVGGVKQLAAMPACNVKVVGKSAQILAGQSTQTARPHQGVVFTAPVVMELPPSMRQKGGQVVAGKAVLAARIDAAAPTGRALDCSQGRALRAAIDTKFERWRERAPAKTLQPLPIPGEVKRTHRGGRRARKEKERMGLTDVRKLRNRVRFGVQEATASGGADGDGDDDGLGMLARDAQRVRVATKATDTLSIAASRKIAKSRRNQRRSNASASAASGFATNLAFGNSSGIQLGAMTPAPGGVGLGDKDDGAKSQYFDVDTPFVGAAAARGKKKGQNKPK